MRWIIVVAVLVVAGIGIALLVSGGDSEADRAMAQVCDARAEISRQVDELRGLTLTTATTSQVGEIVQAIRDDLSRIADARADLAEENRDEVDRANEEFAATVRETIATVARTTSVEDASSQLQEAVQNLAATYRETYGTIDCD